MSRLAGRVALVTGAAGGIGGATARRLVEGGARVVLADLDRDALAAQVRAHGWSEGQALPVALDVRRVEDWRAALDAAAERWGEVDLLYNVAGILRPGPVHAAPVEEVALHLDVNAKGVLLGTRLATERMVARGRGHVVNVASMAALAPIPGLALYSASKFAVRAYSLIAAQELRPLGVHVTVVCPDAVQTPMLDLQLDHPEAALTFSGGKVLTADDVAEALVGPRVVRARPPMEVWLPRRRGLLARFGDLLPAAGFRIGEVLTRRGLARQAQLREGR